MIAHYLKENLSKEDLTVRQQTIRDMVDKLIELGVRQEYIKPQQKGDENTIYIYVLAFNDVDYLKSMREAFPEWYIFYF